MFLPHPTRRACGGRTGVAGVKDCEELTFAVAGSEAATADVGRHLTVPGAAAPAAAPVGKDNGPPSGACRNEVRVELHTSGRNVHSALDRAHVSRYFAWRLGRIGFPTDAGREPSAGFTANQNGSKSPRLGSPGGGSQPLVKLVGRAA